MPEPVSPLQRYGPPLALGLAAVLALAVLVLALEVLCLIFAGVVLGVFLAEASTLLARRLRLPRLPALGLLLAGGAVLAALLGLALLPSVLEQGHTLVQELPRYLQDLRTWLEQAEAAGTPGIGAIAPGLRGLLNGGQTLDLLQQGGSLFGRVAGVFSSGIGVLGGIIIVSAIALYVALEAGMYRRGLLLLVPTAQQDLAARVLERVGHVLAWWFVGQLLSMTVLGSVMFLGLWLIGIPFALLFALITAFMTFIPNLGPIIAAVPPLLMAMTQSLEQTVSVLVLVLVLQNLEGLVLTPMVHRRLIALPPALVLASLLVLGSLAGLIGAIITMPLVAAVIAAAKVLVVEPREAARAEAGRAASDPDGGAA